MGKAELSKVSTFQMVVLFMIAELAAIPIDSPSASVINGITAIFTLIFLEVLLSFLSIKSEKLKNFINGKPSLLIDKGMINIKEMERMRITINDLFEQLRIDDCPSISDVEYAVMEANGELSIIKKTPPQKIPMVLISDGIVYETNLQKAGIDENVLKGMLESKGIHKIENVFVAFYDTSRQFHVYPRPEHQDAFAKEAM
jgi:uncharacterized membrane protein YcaP (DUF421 family)